MLCSSEKLRESERAELILTESEALGLWWLLLRGLAVDCSDVTLLAAVVAAVAAAHSAAPHRREDDLDAVQAGGQVGPWKAHTHLHEEEQQRKQLAEDELHLSSFSLTVTHSHSGQREVYLSVWGCVLTTGQWQAVAGWLMCHGPANKGESTIR